MRSVLLAAVLSGACLLAAQELVSQNPSLQPVRQEKRDADHEHDSPTGKKSIGETTARLKRSVNGRAVVRNQCQSQGHEVQIEEGTDITEMHGCNLVLRTRKVSTSEKDEPKEVVFTLYANLAELTTPTSVQPLISPCKPVDGPILKVMSRTEPGKTLRSMRRLNVQNRGQSFPGTEEQSIRRDLSFFFSDAAAANKAARALDRAIEACGGKEWPDEDDLP